ncbi:LysR family transcriptional regulator [Pseudonocardia kujensis]|uniref:LysR family transcriptional regulator n=1 Tax=Pseudonocardia kujensis TaxID=1128675 RepID=UPI001E4B8B91|nr:LysR family transcriptional regulator [Pseudonocardia kujensis]MCE0762513.1 LysR family transcriptional regulator [Pseudonocardia kujensis]
MAFDLLDLRLFLAVAEHGSITRAAELVHLSLASASARIRAMEAASGAPLLDRHRRGVVPTRPGTLLLAHAREIVERHDRMRLELADLAGRPATVTVLANTAASTLLPGVLVGFLADHPDADVDVLERPSHRIVVGLTAGRAEFGLVADTVDLGGLETVRLRPDPLRVACAPDHPLVRTRSLTFADVLDQPFVGYAEGSPLEEHLRRHTLPLGAHPRHRGRFPDTATVCRAVAAGIGIAVLPARSIPDGLVGVSLDDAWADRHLLLATRDLAGLSRPARALAERVRTELSG